MCVSVVSLFCGVWRFNVMVEYDLSSGGLQLDDTSTFMNLRRVSSLIQCG